MWQSHNAWMQRGFINEFMRMFDAFSGMPLFTVIRMNHNTGAAGESQDEHSLGSDYAWDHYCLIPTIVLLKCGGTNRQTLGVLIMSETVCGRTVRPSATRKWGIRLLVGIIGLIALWVGLVRFITPLIYPYIGWRPF
jgi:hypothetical protein